MDSVKEQQMVDQICHLFDVVVVLARKVNDLADRSGEPIVGMPLMLKKLLADSRSPFDQRSDAEQLSSRYVWPDGTPQGRPILDAVLAECPG